LADSANTQDKAIAMPKYLLEKCFYWGQADTDRGRKDARV